MFEELGGKFLTVVGEEVRQIGFKFIDKNSTFEVLNIACAEVIKGAVIYAVGVESFLDSLTAFGVFDNDEEFGVRE